MAVALVHSLCRAYIFCPRSLGTLQPPLRPSNVPYVFFCLQGSLGAQQLS
uniref:Uncharacterized protein n=1 Tax=Echinococcus granulosus TaxID=6210 RepID=A0A068WFA4_ECHGR|nr:hypothetical protein EgrG_000869900 [Echinococcus granulosus]